MLEKQLQKHWYFQYTGGYSIKKNSRSVLDSLNYSVELLRQAENMVVMFPQGKIHSLYQNKIVFEKGIERIVEHIAPDTQILFVANLVDYLSDSKPNLYIYVKAYLAKDINQTDIQLEYNQFYEQVLNAHKTKIS